MSREIQCRQTLAKLVWRKPFGKLTMLIIAGECLAVTAGCAVPVVQKFLIDGAASGNRPVIWLTLFLMAFLIGGCFVLRTAARRLRGSLSVLARHELQSKIFSHLMMLPEDFLQSRGVGYFFNRIQNDIGEVTVYIANGGLAFCPEILKLLLALGAIAVLDWKYALLLLPFAGIQAWLCFFFRPKQYRLARKIQEKTAGERHVMLEYMNSHRLMKTHNAAQDAQERVDAGLSDLSRMMHRKLDHDNLLQFLLQLPVWICGAGVVLSGMLRVADRTATLGEVWAVLGLLMLAFAPIRMLGSIFAQAQSAEAAWQRMVALWAEQPEETVESAGESGLCLQGDIDFREITFGYQSDQVILKDLSIHIPGGSGVFLVGANGSGKSTLLALLLRLFEVQAGSISIAGRPIQSFPLAGYRSRIGYIGQQPEFFKGTLRENLLTGTANASDQEIEDLFGQLGFPELLNSRPQKLEAPVMENGGNFSGGEKLRLALVRELLRDTDILLLDEPAANLDLAGRQQFYKLLQYLPGRRTVLAVVHDLPADSSWQVVELVKQDRSGQK